MQEVNLYDNERRFIVSNWTADDFTGYVDGVATIIKSGATVDLPMFKAYHFTKHLVDREMMKDGKDGSMNSPEARKVYEDKTIMEITGGVDSPALASIKEKIKEEIEAEVKVKKVSKAKKEEKEEKTGEFEDIQ